jgi:GTP cyclohydrolase III
MIYLYIDGDDIGLRIERTFMENDEVMLRQVNEDIQDIVRNISTYLQDTGFAIIFSGADGVICKGEQIDVEKLLYYINRVSADYTFSVGAGKTLQDAFLSLRYAKSLGKNVAVIRCNRNEVQVIRVD